jgi:hypothetical protein
LIISAIVWRHSFYRAAPFFYILLISREYDGWMRARIGKNIKVGDVSFGIAAAFLFGIFAANMEWNIFLLAAAGIVMGGMMLLFCPRLHGSWNFILFLFCAAIAGVLYYHAYTSWQIAHTHMPSGKSAAFFGVVVDAPKAAGKYTMLVVSLMRPYAGTVDIFTFPDSSQFHYGDELWISGSVTTDAPSGDTNDAGEAPAMFLPQLRVVAQHQGLWLKEVVINIEQSIVQKIAQALPADQAALLVGILLGTSGTLGVALKAQMEASGTSYIVNMYGYKIIIITFALTAAVKDRVPRRALLWITLGAIALFVFISGGTISVIRRAWNGQGFQRSQRDHVRRFWYGHRKRGGAHRRGISTLVSELPWHLLSRAAHRTFFPLDGRGHAPMAIARDAFAFHQSCNSADCHEHVRRFFIDIVRLQYFDYDSMACGDRVRRVACNFHLRRAAARVLRGANHERALAIRTFRHPFFCGGHFANAGGVRLGVCDRALLWHLTVIFLLLCRVTITKK